MATNYDNPSIYVADLKAYNEGKLIGEWVDLTEFDEGYEVMEKISDLMDGYSKKYHNGMETEYAIHDFENFSRELYSESMGEEDFDIILKTHKISEERDIPAEVLQDVMARYDSASKDIETFIDDRYRGQFDTETDFAYDYVDMIGGIENVGKDDIDTYFDYASFGSDYVTNYIDVVDGHYFDSSYKKGGEIKTHDLKKYMKRGGGIYPQSDISIVGQFAFDELITRKFGQNPFMIIGRDIVYPINTKNGVEQKYVERFREYDSPKDVVDRIEKKSMEGRFAKGGKLKSFFSKAKEVGGKAYEKGREVAHYTKEKAKEGMHNASKKNTMGVLNKVKEDRDVSNQDATNIEITKDLVQEHYQFEPTPFVPKKEMGGSMSSIGSGYSINKQDWSDDTKKIIESISEIRYDRLPPIEQRTMSQRAYEKILIDATKYAIKTLYRDNADIFELQKATREAGGNYHKAFVDLYGENLTYAEGGSMARGGSTNYTKSGHSVNGKVIVAKHPQGHFLIIDEYSYQIGENFKTEQDAYSYARNEGMRIKGDSYAKGGLVNKEFLSNQTLDYTNRILQSIADYYGTTKSKIQRELYDEDAEMIYEYIGNDRGLRKLVYDQMESFKYRNNYAKGGNVGGKPQRTDLIAYYIDNHTIDREPPRVDTIECSVYVNHEHQLEAEINECLNNRGIYNSKIKGYKIVGKNPHNFSSKEVSKRPMFNKGGRVDEMVNSFKKYGYAKAHIHDDTEDFFERIGIDSDEIGTTSEYGTDIIFYDTKRKNKFNTSWDNYAKGGEIKSRKKDGFLDVEIDGKKYRTWLWNGRSVKDSLRKDLVENNEWIGEVETESGNSESFRFKDNKNSPYYKGDDYLNNKKVRDILIEEANKIHNKLYAKGGMTKSMEVDEVMQDHFAKGGKMSSGIEIFQELDWDKVKEKLAVEKQIFYNDLAELKSGKRKTMNLYFVQGNDGSGFEDIIGEKTIQEALIEKENHEGIGYNELRVVRRRVNKADYEDWSEKRTYRYMADGGSVGKNITYSATFDLMDADGNNIDNPMPSLQFDVSSDVSYGDAKGIGQRAFESGNFFEEGMKAVMTDFWMGEMDADEEDRKRVEVQEEEEREEFVPKVERSGKWDASYSVLCDELATYEQGGDVKDFSYEEDILPILKESIDDGVDEIDDYENVGDAQGEEVEYKSRSGFIPYTNGGYEKKWFEYISILNGSGTSLPTKVLDDEMERQVDNAYETAKEQFIENNEELVEEIGEEKVNYSDLYELEMGDKAEELSEMERDMGDDSIMMSVKAFYFNPSNSRAENNQHTITLIGDVNLEAPYHRSGNMDDYKEITFTFNSKKELEDKMSENIEHIIDWFGGDGYSDSTREMKIRRMAKGGSTFAEGGLIEIDGKMYRVKTEHRYNSDGVYEPFDVYEEVDVKSKGGNVVNTDTFAKGGSMASGGGIGRKEWEKQVIKEIPKNSDYDLVDAENIIGGYPDYFEFLSYWQDGKTPKETAIIVLDKLGGSTFAEGGEIKRGIFKGYEQTKRGVLIPLQKAPIGFGVQETPKASVLIGLEFNKYDITLTNVDFDIVLIKGMVCALITQKGKGRLKVNIEKGNYTLDDVIFQLKKGTTNYFNTYAEGGKVDKLLDLVLEKEELLRQEKEDKAEILQKKIKRAYDKLSSKEKQEFDADADNLAFAKGGKMASGGVLTKEELKLNIYEPSGDYYMDKKGGKIILHLTSKDASNLPPSFFEKYNVENNGKGHYGTSYIVSKKSMAKGGNLKTKEQYEKELRGLKKDLFDAKQPKAKILIAKRMKDIKLLLNTKYGSTYAEGGEIEFDEDRDMRGIEIGDLVDFGSKGTYYISQYDGGQIIVVDSIDEIGGSKGKSFYPYSAKQIISREEDYAKGGSIKGRNNKSGESFGVVIGSKEFTDDNKDRISLNVRSGYSSRMSERKLVFDTNGNLIETLDYGYTLDGSNPNTNGGSGRHIGASNKKETIDAMVDLGYNKGFANKVIEFVKE